MTDLHAGRGPTRSHLAAMLFGLALTLFCAGVFTEGLGGPGWLELGLKGLSIVAGFMGVWRTAIQARRWKDRRSEASAER